MTTRRSFLANFSLAAASVLVLRRPLLALQASETPAANVLQSMRAAAETAPIQVTKLTDTIFLLQGIGANIVAMNGPDGKLLIDSGIATGSHRLLDAVTKLGSHPLRILVNTSFLFDHTDGNAALHAAGAFILAQENTRIRLAAPQKIPMFNMELPSSPSSALPQATFNEGQKLFFNNDELDMIYAPGASTDSDIFVHFVNGNVIHTGELWLNGGYPIIDTAAGGTINGMIQGVDQILQLADDRTKIVPGHGQFGNKGALAGYRQMLATVANHVEKLKIAGQTLNQVLAVRVTADLDNQWGHGEVTPTMFVTAIYNTL